MTVEEFRTRWLRWLGQKTRRDKPYWVTLLDSNWSGWPSKVLEKHNIQVEALNLSSSRMIVKSYYTKAIKCADIDDLMRLDGLYCDEKIQKEH